MKGIADIDTHEIVRRKERVRRAWDYLRVDHIPIGFFIEDYSLHTLRELCESGELQFEANVRNIDRLLRILPDDYIPAARLWPGYMTIATMFGLPVHWSEDPNQAPGVGEHLLRDIQQVYALRMPDPEKDGLMPFNLRWLEYFKKNLPDCVSLTGIDLGGPLNSAKDLFDTNLLYTAFYDSPEEYHRFLSMAADHQVRCCRAVVEAAGGLDRLTCIDFDPFWAPEGRKGFVSDDVCATISPGLFASFSVPYNNRIFSAYRGGRLHNCGPNPSAHLYLEHTPEINGLNCSYKYSRGDLIRLKKAFKGKGIVEFMFDNGESFNEIIAGYEEIARVLCPDVVGIAFVWLNGDWRDDDIRELYHELKKIAEDYSRSMNWRAG
jgi:uroporphyrinogen-III decarboxylase